MSAAPNRKLHKQGKEWEAQVGRALRQTCGHVLNSNQPSPCCDWRAVWEDGRSVLVECKETESNELRFDAITDAEYTNLTDHAAAGGISLVLVSRVGPNWRRGWACSWSDWQALERELGQRKRQVGMRKVSLAWGGKLSLDQVPGCFVELEGREIAGIETWVLAPAIARAAGMLGGDPSRCDDSCQGCEACWPIAEMGLRVEGYVYPAPAVAPTEIGWPA